MGTPLWKKGAAGHPNLKKRESAFWNWVSLGTKKAAIAGGLCRVEWLPYLAPMYL